MTLKGVDNKMKAKRGYQSQLRTVSHYLYHNTASRFMTAIETDIPIQNVCRYVDMLRKHGHIAVVRHDRCEVSGEVVEYLTTNPVKFPRDEQLKLFEL